MTLPGAWNYATRPTRMTLFLRTFLLYQLWRFAWINLKMLAIVRRSHGGRGGQRESSINPFNSI